MNKGKQQNKKDISECDNSNNKNIYDNQCNNILLNVLDVLYFVGTFVNPNSIISLSKNGALVSSDDCIEARSIFVKILFGR